MPAAFGAIEATLSKGSQAEDGLMKTTLLRWVRRWRERDDLHLFKPAALLPVDPLEELIRVVNEAQERDAEDERRLYPARGERRSPYQRRPDRR
jgi:transposase-like protein